MHRKKKRKVNLPQRATRAAFVPSTFNEQENTIDICWTTGAEGERCEWDGEVYLESLQVDEKSVRLGRLNNGAPVLNTHQSDELSKVIGVVVRAWIENGEGHATVKFSTRSEVQGIIKDILAGVIRNISVGYVVYSYRRVAGQDGEPDKMIAIDWEPLEISFVPVPFDAGAQSRGGAEPRTFTATIIDTTKGITHMRTVKQIRTAIAAARAALLKAREVEDEAKIEEAQEELETLVAELDEALDTLDEGTGAGLAGEDGVTQPGAPPANETEEERKKREEEEASAGEDGTDAEKRARTAERSRITAIRTFARKFKVEETEVDKLIARGATIDQAKVSILTTLQERQQNINSSNGGHVSGKAEQKKREHMSQAILNRAAPGKHKLPEEARHMRGLTLLDMAKECIEDKGGRTRGMDRHEIARIALNVTGFSQQRAAGMHSTSDFPLILGNTINRSLRAAYDEYEQEWKVLGRQANFQDFRPRISVALGEASALEKVKEGGEYKYGTLPEEGTQVKAEKWGKIIALTWEAIVNDDLNAFDKIPAALAASARNTESSVVWDLLLKDVKYSDGVNVFAAGHNNIAATAGPINATTLQAARTALRTQKGLDKKTFIRQTPKYLVVGPLNEMAAYQWTSASYFPAQAGDQNPVYNTQLVTIVDPAITDYTWFMVAEGAETFEWGYLDGEGGMITDTREGFEVDGVEVKARLVFGAGWVDYRGAYKNAGAAS